jgi:hypothetical protein
MLGRTVGASLRRLTVVGAVAVLSTVGGSFLAGAAPASAAPGASKAAVVSPNDTYGSCNYVNDWDRPTKRYGAGLPPRAPDAYVKQIQCLINVGSTYPQWLTVDGQFGSRTDAAVHWVQNCNHTTGGSDGVVGQWTWLDLYIPDSQCAL